MKYKPISISPAHYYAGVLLFQEGSRYERNESLHILDGGYCLDRMPFVPAGSMVQANVLDNVFIPGIVLSFIH